MARPGVICWGDVQNPFPLHPPTHNTTRLLPKEQASFHPPRRTPCASGCLPTAGTPGGPRCLPTNPIFPLENGCCRAQAPSGGRLLSLAPTPKPDPPVSKLGSWGLGTGHSLIGFDPTPTPGVQSSPFPASQNFPNSKFSKFELHLLCRNLVGIGWCQLPLFPHRSTRSSWPAWRRTIPGCRPSTTSCRPSTRRSTPTPRRVSPR